MANKIKTGTYSGAGKVHDQTDGLADTVRKLAQDMARTRTNLFTDMTNSSGGTSDSPDAATTEAQAGKSVAAFTETGTASAPKAGFDTATGKIGDALAVLAEYMNRINASLGIDLIVDNSGGTVATQGTIAALDLTLTAVSSNTLDVVTGRTVLETIKENVARAAGFANRIAVAVGNSKITITGLGGYDGSNTFEAVVDTGAAVDGTADSTIADAVIDTELTAIANNIATVADFLIAITGAQLSDLTGTLAGTPSDTDIEVQTVPSVAVAGAATTSAPKAAFDTELVLIEKNMADLANRCNLLLERNGLTTIITNNTGVTPDAALDDIDPTLAAVDGSSGTLAVDFITGSAVMLETNDSIATIVAQTNILAGVYGLQTLTDASGGTVGTAVENTPPTDTGVSGADSTILDAVMDAWLAALLNNIESLQVKLNDMTTADATTDLPLQVVAWDS